MFGKDESPETHLRKSIARDRNPSSSCRPKPLDLPHPADDLVPTRPSGKRLSHQRRIPKRRALTCLRRRWFGRKMDAVMRD